MGIQAIRSINSKYNNNNKFDIVISQYLGICLCILSFILLILPTFRIYLLHT